MKTPYRAVLRMAVVAFALLPFAVSGATSSVGQQITELRWATTPIKGLDQTRNYAYPDLTVQRLGVEHLMQFSTTGRLQPSLAQAVRHPNPRTYVYTLRNGVRFWNGAPMTAEDVAASLERNRSDTSTIAVFYRNVASVAVTGAREVTVRLRSPDSSWPASSAIATPIVQKAFADAHAADIGSPGVLNMGTGPFKFVDFQLDQRVVLERNPNWWGGRVGIDRVTISLLPSASAISVALRSGSIDGYLTRGEDLRPFGRIPNTTLSFRGGSTPMYISMNTRTGPWSDVHVRRAVAHLVDRPSMIKGVEGGFGVPLDTLLPRSLITSIATPAQAKAFYGSYKKYPFSLAAAKREMAQSKYPKGFSATWPIYNVTDAVAVAQVMAQNLKKIDINIQVKQQPFAQWLSGYYGPRNKIGVTNLTYGNATYPAYHFDLMVNSANAKPQGSNSADYRNARVDRLLKANAVAQASTAQLAALRGVAQQVANDVPYVVLFAQANGLVLSNKYVMRGFADTWQFRPWALNIQPK